MPTTNASPGGSSAQAGGPQQFAVVRLGGESEDAITEIDAATPTEALPFQFSIKCKQVPKDLSPGAFACVWLGTNNNKGGDTPWVQGLRALGRIEGVTGGPKYNDEKTVAISIGVILPKSLTKKDFIRATRDDYIAISDLPVVGINNYSSQVIQLIDPSAESQEVDVLLAAVEQLAPGFGAQATARYPALSSLLAAKPKSTSAPKESDSSSKGVMAVSEEKMSWPKLPVPPSDDPAFTELLARVRRLLKDGFGGIVLRGPPGTSKSYYARLISSALTDQDSSRVRFVQFHPSYQYEDFVEGLVPDDTGIFKPVRKVFLEICGAAEGVKDGSTHVIVVDELSRTDPARVFGEALTYLEADKRGDSFQLASGRRTSIPQNVVVIATMNVWDRGIDEVDAALERRFASIALDPDRDSLLRILEKNGVEEDLQDRVVRFFDALQRDPNPNVRIGHAYFRSVRDESSVHRLWNSQLRFVMERAFPLERDGLDRIQRLWTRSFPETSALEPEAKDSQAGS